MAAVPFFDALVCTTAVLAALAYLVKRYVGKAGGCGSCPSKSKRNA